MSEREIMQVLAVYLAIGVYFLALLLYHDRPRASWRMLIGIPVSILLWPLLLNDVVRGACK